MTGGRPAWLREVVLLADPRAGELLRAVQDGVPGDAPAPSVLLDAGRSLNEAAVAVAMAGCCMQAPPVGGSQTP